MKDNLFFLKSVVCIFDKMRRSKSSGWFQQCRGLVISKNHVPNFGYSGDCKRPWTSEEQLCKKR